MRPHRKPPALHLLLVLLQLRRLLFLGSQQALVLLAANPSLCDAAKGHDSQSDSNEAQDTCDDTRLGSSGQGFPVLTDARWILDFLEHVGLSFTTRLSDNKPIGDEEAATYAMTLTFSQVPLESMSSQLYSFAVV